MGKGGRAPCCDKSKVKRGPWSPAEDLKLITFIQKHGHENWRALPKQAGLLRCGKSCRLRWINYLRPDVKRGNFTIEEEDTIIRLHQSFGNKWSKIASYLAGRTDNEIKNVWNTHLKKRLMGSKNNDNSQSDELTKESSMASSSSSSSTSYILYPKRNAEMAASDQEIQDLSPASSTVSNISNPGEANISGKEEKMASMFNYRNPNPNFDVNDTLHEVNKPGSLQDVTLESDIDFWDMIDDLSTFASNDEIAACQSSEFGDEYVREIENEKWLKYLENELGLEENQENLANDKVDEIQFKVDEIQFKPEIDEAMDCFQMWPSWLQNSVI